MFVMACKGVPWNHLPSMLSFTLFAITWTFPFVLLLMIQVFVERLQPRQQTLRSFYRAEFIASVLTLALMVYPLALPIEKGDFGDALLVVMFPIITVPFAIAVAFVVWGFDSLFSRFQSRLDRTPNQSAHGTR